MFLMFNNIWNERVFRTVLKLPLKPLLLFLFFFFFFMPPVMYLMVWPLECFLASIRAQFYVMTKEVKKKKKKNTKIEGTENIHHFGPVIFELPFMKFWRHVNLAILIN